MTVRTQSQAGLSVLTVLLWEREVFNVMPSFEAPKTALSATLGSIMSALIVLEDADAHQQVVLGLSQDEKVIVI